MKPRSVKDNIRIYTRIMPTPALELEQGLKPIVGIDDKTKIVTLKSSISDENPRKFQFTDAFNDNSTQKEVFERTAIPIVQDFLHGYNCALFTYGHTKTGKTFTIEGDLHNEEFEGIMPRAFRYIFNYINSLHHEEFILRASYLEIYAENYRDLLSEKKEQSHQKIEIFHSFGRTQFHGITEYLINSPKELLNLLRYGSSCRTKSESNTNISANGSHTIFKLILERQNKLEKGNKSKISELSFVDLAGTDKFTEGELTPDKLRQCSKVNLSLFELGNVIKLIAENSSYIPFRNSKLTSALRNCLGGNAKTSIITTVNPFISHYSETLSSFLFAARANQIVNCPVINEDPRNSLIRSLRVKIAQLRQELLNRKSQTELSLEEKDRLEEITKEHQVLMTSLSNQKEEEDKKNEATRLKLDSLVQQRESLEATNNENEIVLRLQIDKKNQEENDLEKIESQKRELKKMEMEIVQESTKYVKEAKEMKAEIKKKKKDIAFLNFVISQFIPDQLDKTLPIPTIDQPPKILVNHELMVGEYKNSIRVLGNSEILNPQEESSNK